MLMIAMTLKK